MWLCVIYIWFVFQELSSCFLFILHLIYLFTYSFIYFFLIDKTCLILSNSFFSEKTTSHNSNAIMKKKNRRKNYFIWCVYFRSPKLDRIPCCRNCQMIRPKFYRICVFLQSFHSRKSGLIVMFYAVVYKLDIKVYRKVSILIQKHTADISANINTNSKNHKKYLYSTSFYP